MAKVLGSSCWEFRWYGIELAGAAGEGKVDAWREGRWECPWCEADMAPKEPKTGTPALPLAALDGPLAAPDAAEADAIDPATETAADAVVNAFDESGTARDLEAFISLSKGKLEKGDMPLVSFPSPAMVSRRDAEYLKEPGFTSAAADPLVLGRLFENAPVWPMAASSDGVAAMPFDSSLAPSRWRAGDGLEEPLRSAALLSAFVHGRLVCGQTSDVSEPVEKVLDAWFPFVKVSSWPAEEEKSRSVKVLRR